MAGSHPLNSEVDSNRLTGHDWFEIRKQVLKRDDYRCRNCDASANLVVHHIVPIGAKGTNQLPNLATLCRACHRRAHNERIRDSGREQSTEVARYLLTVDELRQLFQMATHPLERASIAVLVKTGIGVGELCNLDLDDLQLPASPFELSSVDIPHDIGLLRIRYGGALPYNNRRERSETTYVPIDDELVHVLKKWLAVKPDSRSGDPLFLSTRGQWGKRISPQMVRNPLESHGRALGLYNKDSQMSNLTPYALRYLFEERFAGQPSVREYILGRRTDIDWSIEEIATHYRQHIFELGLV